MDTQDQLQAIVDRLVGSRRDVPLDAFDEPWRTVYPRLSHAASASEAGDAIRAAVRDLPDASALACTLVELLPPDAAFSRFPSLLDMAPGSRPVDWLWPGWIPRGSLTILVAAPGAGKSLVALDLARRVIAGEPFPDGAPVPNVGANVLLVDAEGPLTLLDQRAQAWGMDRSRLFLMLPKAHAPMHLASPDQVKLLSDMVRQLEPGLVIVDSLGAATPGGEMGHKNLRVILASLSFLAGAANAAVLIIHHLRKRTASMISVPAGTVTADDLRGSSHIIAVARSIVALCPSAAPFSADDPGLEFPRRLEVIKANLCRRPPALGVVFESGSLGAPTLRYTGPLAGSAAPSHLALCARWLLDHLAAAGEPLRPADVVRAARDAGFAYPTLYRARSALGAQIADACRSVHNLSNRWTLAPAPSPGDPGPCNSAPEGTPRKSETLKE